MFSLSLGPLKLVMILCKLLPNYQHDNALFCFKRNYRFLQKTPSVSASSTELFLIVLKQVLRS